MNVCKNEWLIGLSNDIHIVNETSRSVVLGHGKCAKKTKNLINCVNFSLYMLGIQFCTSSSLYYDTNI